MKRTSQVLRLILALILTITFALIGLAGVVFTLLSVSGYEFPAMTLIGFALSGVCGYWAYKLVTAMRRSSLENMRFD
jgi:uncharacterized integral membrane protein